jgi:hypothetical protein
MAIEKQKTLLLPLRFLCLVPLALIAIFVFGASSLSIQTATVIFWAAHLATLICLFFIVPLARSFGKSGLLWAIGTVVFSPIGPAVSGFRLVSMFDALTASNVKT